MPFKLTCKLPPAVYCPTRADRRTVRAVLANLRDGEPSADLERIASGSPVLAVRFLAACRGLAFVAVVHGIRGAAFSFCGPDRESAVDLCRCVQELQPPHARPSCPAPGSLSAGQEGRATVLRDAVERIVSALHDRDDCVSLVAWQVDGEAAVGLDYSPRLPRDVALYWVRWFLTERLQAASSSSSFNAHKQPGVSHV